MIYKQTRSRGGETGRHARLKIWWALARAGSIPALGTTHKCGSSSVVEHDLAKVGVAGSTPVSRSIILFFLISFFTTFLYADTIQLKSKYLIDSEKVKLSLFTGTESNRTILELPKNRNLWKVPAFKISRSLKMAGYESKMPSSSMITFERALNTDFPKLRRLIGDRYREYYPTLRLKDISVKPTAFTGIDFTFKPECSIRLPKSALHKSIGTFAVRCKKKVYYFRYTLEGMIRVYKANHQIKKDKIIDSNKVHAEYIPFEKFYAPPITDPGDGRYIARLNIAPSKVLTAANTEPLPAVLKNSSVRCVYRVGSVVIEFDATALQNGKIGDIISVKKSDGKILRGRVVNKKRVELE